jgi:S-adenosylmethionine hydrolase
MGRIVTLLTDFGTFDGFVGAMKGVVLSHAPDARVIDLTHEIPPHDIRCGAWALREASQTFPVNAIHIAVVDPGVGTKRRPILISCREQLFVGPDNGLLSLAAPRGDAWLLDRRELFREEVSRTFHGRDIFASVAGHLAAGVSPDRCGSPISSWECIEESRPTRRGDSILGEVLHSDRFGNLVTNIDIDVLDGTTKDWMVSLNERPIGTLRGTFGDVGPGEWVAYLGSSGFVEVAIREGNAASNIPVKAQPTVTLWKETRQGKS